MNLMITSVVLVASWNFLNYCMYVGICTPDVCLQIFIKTKIVRGQEYTSTVKVLTWQM